MKPIWPVSKILLTQILDDRITDTFVSELVWERLGYKKINHQSDLWLATQSTPVYWSKEFPESPEVIAKRKASVYLTRSIPKEYKQSLKKFLAFKGYLISELSPRRTRRATVVNWLLALLDANSQILPKEGPLPILLDPPLNPLQGHPGDNIVE